MRGRSMEMNYSETPWALSEEECPCDLHFVEYLVSKNIEGKLIFHFGTGNHHIVGKTNHQRGNPNEIIATTLCKQESDSYIDFVIRNPVAANFYKVLFADIYTLSARMLPSFDLVTLFHLAEGYDQPPNYDGTYISNAAPGTRLNSAYARLNDVTLLELFLQKLTPAGKLFFYPGSDAFREPYQAGKIISDFIRERKMVVEEQYKSLLICRRP
jgi:hypothetical protein